MLAQERSLLCIVDVQAGLAAAVAHGDERIGKLQLLLSAASRLTVPVLVTEHYPQGLGHTDPRLDPLPERCRVLGKISFSAWQEPTIQSALEASGRSQIVIAGMETHVCVLQTALDLEAAGFDVHLVADASGSRQDEDRTCAIDRLARHGVEIVTAEMVVFEWLARGDTADFKALIPLIKASGSAD